MTFPRIRQFFLIGGLSGALLAGCASHGDPLPGKHEETIEAADDTLNVTYYVSGNPDAQRVIYVHGTPGSASAWSDYLADKPDDFEYVAIDRPGFGASSPDRAVVSLEDQADAILPLLVERGGKWPILVGHSLGGPIIAKVAAMAPDKVGGLVIVAGSFDPGLEKILFIQRIGETWPFNRILPSAIRNSNRELIALKPELEALEADLTEITCPVIVIHGTKDSLVPYSNVAFLQPKLENAQSLEVVTLDGQNHFLPWNAKQEIVAAYKGLAAIPISPERHIVIDQSSQTR